MAPLIPKTTIGRGGTKRDTPKGVLSRLSRYHPPPVYGGTIRGKCPVLSRLSRWQGGRV